MFKKAAVSAVFATVCVACVLSIQEQTGPQLQCPAPKTSNVKVVIRTQQNQTGHWISRVAVKQRMGLSEGRESDHWQVDVEQNTETCGDEDSVLETVFYLSAPPSTRGKPAQTPSHPTMAVTTPTQWGCPSPVPCPVTAQPPTPVQEPPSGYTRYAGVGFYKYHTQAASWLEAKKICEDEGGYLAVINSDREAGVMESLMNFYPTSIGSGNDAYVYVGAHRIGTTYYTVLGGELTKTGYVRWVVNEPSGNNEFCLSLHKPNAHFNDVPCAYKLAFICEHPTKD